jgi:hypothetical protein
MIRKTKLIERVPQKLHIVFRPRIDAVGLNMARVFAAFANGKENDKADTQIPSMNTQLECSRERYVSQEVN